MSLAIRRLVDRFYPRPTNGYKIPLLGLDASGKTSLLYRLKLGEIVVTIPTIGLNIEKIQVRAAHGNSQKTITMMCWDVGGCSKLGPAFMAPYTAGSDALIWLVDGCDRERIAESVEELSRHIHFINGTDRPNYPLPVLIISTKQDFPNPIPLEKIRAQFASVVSNSPIFVLGYAPTQSLTVGEVPESFGWLMDAIERTKAGMPAPSAPGAAGTSPDPRSAAALESKLDAWLDRATKDSSPEEFLRQFGAFSLPAWDHYTHIRVAYLLLTIYGRQKGKDMIFDGIEKYIAQSEQTRGRTFHVTMTYFWIQMVHFGIQSMPPPVLDSSSDGSTVQTLVGEDEFARFLLLNPFVADGNLWTEYYSKEVIMSPEAKASLVLPDRKPLPNLVARDAIVRPGR
ncbi:ADP-ribosylation factor [Mycena crocata]|nr:ADP-ribosylation factor [Mycena crocata]